uniref:Disease resistance N-terminal domain-containing protein n=1 Tax=Fagus sylvatica TaxID=28930 RepID=A0A2N9GET1_FAGSY
MAIAELFLSAFIQALFERLLSPELLKYARREGVGKKLEKWRNTLSIIQGVLDDAEDKQQTDRADWAVKGGWMISETWFMIWKTYWMSSPRKNCASK